MTQKSSETAVLKKQINMMLFKCDGGDSARVYPWLQQQISLIILNYYIYMQA